ncbi:MAG: hypothetical protein LBT53_06190, partial [Puniceicoccales bacterium]|nr:hypothetical protein [Puniceicoccales bacterium]
MRPAGGVQCPASGVLSSHPKATPPPATPPPRTPDAGLWTQDPATRLAAPPPKSTAARKPRPPPP